MDIRFQEEIIMVVKNKNRTEADVRKNGIFGTVMQYEMFCVYWQHLCTRLNKNSINRSMGDMGKKVVK